MSIGNPDRKYQKQEKIGSGASGSVFTAIEINTGAEGFFSKYLINLFTLIFSCHQTNEFKSTAKEGINYQRNSGDARE